MPPGSSAVFKCEEHVPINILITIQYLKSLYFDYNALSNLGRWKSNLFRDGYISNRIRMLLGLVDDPVASHNRRVYLYI